MTENKFWELIEKVFHMPIEKIQEVGYDQIQNEIIKKYFRNNGKDSIKQFHEILCEKIRELYLPKIGELFLMTGYDLSEKINKDFKYISTDGFVDFRAWIVSLGKEHYETFLNFQSENVLSKFDMDANGANREDLVYLAVSFAEEELGEELDLDYHLDKDGEELYSKMNWDSLNEKHPKLFKFYQERFKNGYYDYDE